MQDFEQIAQQTLLAYTGQKDVLDSLSSSNGRQVFLAKQSVLILKVYKDGKILEKEFTFAQKASQAGVPTPKIIGIAHGEPTILIMEFIVGKPLSSRCANAAYQAGQYLQQFHQLGAQPPFSGGQNSWSEFIEWWIKLELEKNSRLQILDDQAIARIARKFKETSIFTNRPVALLHGDLQVDHIIVNESTDNFLALLDFADAQAGDPLLDIAVLSLHDHKLAESVLSGYPEIDTPNTPVLLSLYRLLRLTAEIPWLATKNFDIQVEQNKLEILRQL